MHPDVYSLRGVRLLNQVIDEHIAPEKRPALSVLFNSVVRREQSTFEADARNGVYNAAAGFRLSGALLGAALPRSGHLSVRLAPEPDTALAASGDPSFAWGRHQTDARGAARGGDGGFETACRSPG